MVNTNKQVRSFLNAVSKSMYRKNYNSLNNIRAAKVRKKAVTITNKIKRR